MPEGRRRSLWSGTLSFGLVTIPVELHSALRSTAGVSFRMLAPDGAPVRREYYCPRHQRPVSADEIVRGYELEEGGFVVVRDEELDALAPESSRDISLERFVEPGELSPLAFERAYLLLPSSERTKPYGLLARVLEDSGRVGLARLVLRGRERLVGIYGEGGLLRLQTMRFAEQLRPPSSAGLDEGELGQVEVDEAQVEALRELIATHTREADALEREELVDERAAKIEARAREKLAAGEDLVELEELAQEPGAAPESEIIDLMEVLARSLQRPGAHTQPEPPRSAAPPLAPPRESEGASKQELYEQARELDIAGRSKMSKAELAEAVAAARDRAQSG